MRLHWVLGLALAACVFLVTPPRAEACGVWRMADVGKKLEVKWLINSATITKGARRLAALYLDTSKPDDLRVVARRRTVIDLKDGALRRRGKAVGKLDGATVTIGKRAFTVAFGNQKDLHGMPAWTMTVSLDGQPVVTSDEATALCAPLERARTGGTMTLDEQQAEVVRRVAFYLVWRELGL